MKNYSAIVVLLLFSVFVKAQWTSNTALNTPIMDRVGVEESVPLTATRSDGSTYISYFVSKTDGYDLRMQLIDSCGNKLWTANGLLISSHPQSTTIFRYDLKVDHDDNAIVAFQDIRTNNNLNIVAYKIDRNKNFIWGADGIQLIDSISQQGLGPVIGITNTNNVIIGWNANNDVTKWVSYQKISPTGAVLWNNVHRVIDSISAKKYSRPSIVPCGSDGFTMLYVEESGTSFPPVSKMFAQSYNPYGMHTWDFSTLVSTKTIPFFFFPNAVSDNNNGFYVAFNTGNDNFPTQSDVFIQHVNSNGTTWNANGKIACALTNTQHFVSSARYDKINRKFWVLLQVTDLDQLMSGVYIQKTDTAGNILLGSNGIELLPYTSTYYYPHDLSLTINGVISIYAIGSSSVAQTLAAVKNNFDGAIEWGGLTNPVAICSNSSGKDDLSAGMFFNNQIVIVWDDGRNDYGVYAQNITNEGQVGVIPTNIYYFDKDKSFSVSPNPCTNYLKIQTNKIQTNTKIEILDISGRKIYYQLYKNQSIITFNMEQFDSGIYFIKIDNEIIKVIKQ